ncbi:ABC transporter ATP-binding protein [Ignisphaera sp. 4213-co]|uniref:ABC transporter ATP-binding protein n=1 Tax=Ignisphaera cupida TaxID=3050454 RepID=A0ABD4Z882_9CREN|nr:ABC transporter ATP-binding protein [Ignisphaera sp. 4213-co]MDK6028495.1 ABC transporter ATP-binding protein [Ignisphaera sp. 4213-co]
MNNTDTLLHINNVTKLFGYGLLGLRKFRALNNVSLTMPIEPEILVIVGETGSGKSTLLKIILRMLVPDYGTVLYKGKNIFKMKSSEVRWYRQEVQAVFQDPFETFNPLRPVVDYLNDTLKYLLKVRNASERKTLIDQTLRFVGLSLEKVDGKRSNEFSGGELQRISIARALLSRPKLLLADEPVSMLDASLRVDILNILKDVKENLKTSIIYVTHDILTAYYVGDRIAVLYRGDLVELGPITKVYNEPLHPYTQLLLSSVLEPSLDIRKKVKPLKRSTIELKEFLLQGCKFAMRCPYATKKCYETPPPEIKINGRAVRCWLYVT